MTLTLDEAISLGEYEPEYLLQYPDFQKLSRHVQFEYIRHGLDNRRKHLLSQYAEISNALDFSQKPKLKIAMKNIEKQLHDLIEIKEKLYVEYSI